MTSLWWEVAPALVVDAVSLPAAGPSQNCVSELSGADADSWIEDFLSAFALPTGVAREEMRRSNFAKPYSGPALAEPLVYARLLRRMTDGGLVDLVTDPGNVT